ncbi:MAG: GNAT family N-acetyltransferase [Pseudomonadota bacterium]
MDTPLFTVSVADWVADNAAIRTVREQVFIEEQGVSEADEWDDEDALSWHVLVLTTNRDAVATGRLQSDAKITRMAVLAPWRDQQLGSMVLNALLDIAAQNELPAVWLHAQQAAVGFYKRFGFVPVGEPFFEAGIAHVLMRRQDA